MTTDKKQPTASESTTGILQISIAILAIVGILAHLVLRFVVDYQGEFQGFRNVDLPLIAVLILGGIPLVVDLLGHVLRLEFGSDLLAGISIVTSAILGEYLAGSMVVLMLSGGEALEAYAVRRATSALAALPT